MTGPTRRSGTSDTRTGARRDGTPSPRAPRPPVAGLVLTPGAGSGSDHAGLVAVDAAVSATGVTVLRVDFPYRLAGRRAPDRPPVLVRTVVEEAAALASSIGCPPEAIAVGGRSMGGRMASMAVAEGLPAAALVLISYPLHPPGRPERTRDGHFGQIGVPCLFVSGTRDAFATVDELTAATAGIPGPVEHVWVDGGDHGLRRRDDEVAAEVARWLSPARARIGPGTG